MRLKTRWEPSVHFGPRVGIERCGKIHASHSGAESWTGIGVVAGCGAVVLIRQWPHGRHGEVNWGITLLQILQEVRTIYKTRNQLTVWIRAMADFCGVLEPHGLMVAPD